MFSSRLPPGPGRNRLTQAVGRRRAAGLPIVDLTESNPTHAGFNYPAELLSPLGQAAALRYEPNPLGSAAARQAVSDDFKRRGLEVPGDRIALTASTSEAYSLLFKLLCDPGDAVLVPRPSYPLVEHLSALDAVAVETYRLEFHGRWSINFDELAGRLTDASTRIRAVVTISPNNPTGSVAGDSELKQLAALASRHGVALISDEVFADYPMEPGFSIPSVLAQSESLSFGLGGLSKTVGLPQVKLGWIGVSGPQALVASAMERLEMICDTYLSVSTPVQAAAACLLEKGATVRAQIQHRIRENYAQLRKAAAAHPACSVLPVEAGWSAVLQVPAVRSEEDLVLGLLERAGVLAYPAYFFDFDREAFLVVSLLPEPAIFAEAVEHVFAEAGRS